MNQMAKDYSINIIICPTNLDIPTLNLSLKYDLTIQELLNFILERNQHKIGNKNINTWKIVDVTKKLLNYNFENKMYEIFGSTHYSEITIYTNPNEIPYLKSLQISNTHHLDQQQQIQGQNNYQIADQNDNFLEQDQTVKIIFSILDGTCNKGVFKQDCKLSSTLFEAAQAIYTFLSILKETASFALFLDNQELGQRQQLTLKELGIKKETYIIVKLRWIGGQFNYIDVFKLY